MKSTVDLAYRARDLGTASLSPQCIFGVVLPPPSFMGLLVEEDSRIILPIRVPKPNPAKAESVWKVRNIPV